MAQMTPDQIHLFRLQMLQHTLEPYKIMICILVAIFILFLITKYPKCKVKEVANNQNTPKVTLGETLKYLSGNSLFKKGIIAQFLYVGMQVAVWSFTIRLALDLMPHINERMAADFMVISFVCFFVGKFIANFLMTKFSVNKVLLAYSIIGCILILYVAFIPNLTAIYAAVAISILLGPCWATIYAETLKSVEKKYTETAGAIIVMSIIGGAFMPAVQGFVSDMVGSMQFSFIVNFFCFAYIGWYFYYKMKLENKEG